MSYFEFDADIRLFEQDLGYTYNDETSLKNSILGYADKISFKELREPFDSPIGLQFDDGRSLFLQLEPWKNEQKPLEKKPIIAKIVFVLDNSIYGLGTKDLDSRIIVEGASVEGVNSDIDLATIALNCNLNYRKITERELTFFDPLESGKMLKGRRLKKQQQHILDLLNNGLAYERNNRLYEIRPNADKFFTPPVRQIFETNEGYKVFREN